MLRCVSCSKEEPSTHLTAGFLQRSLCRSFHLHSAAPPTSHCWPKHLPLSWQTLKSEVFQKRLYSYLGCIPWLLNGLSPNGVFQWLFCCAPPNWTAKEIPLVWIEFLSVQRKYFIPSSETSNIMTPDYYYSMLSSASLLGERTEPFFLQPLLKADNDHVISFCEKER